MWVLSLLQYFELLFHQVEEDLVRLDVGTFDRLDSALDSSQSIHALMDLSERSFAEKPSKLVLSADILHLLQALELAVL